MSIEKLLYSWLERNGAPGWDARLISRRLSESGLLNGNIHLCVDIEKPRLRVGSAGFVERFEFKARLLLTESGRHASCPMIYTANASSFRWERGQAKLEGEKR